MRILPAYLKLMIATASTGSTSSESKPMILSHKMSVSEGDRKPTKAENIQGKVMVSAEVPRECRWASTAGSHSCSTKQP